MMPILVKGHDVRSETKANACHRRLWPAQESIMEDYKKIAKFEKKKKLEGEILKRI